MKALFILIVFAMATAGVHAQTNTLPASGNVGIGTLSPRAPLEVVTAGTYFRDQTYTFDISTYAGGGGWARDLRFFDEFNTNARVYFGAIGGNGGVDRAYWVIGNQSDPAYPGYALNNGIHLLSNGNVGIGTSAPRSRLDLGTMLGASSGVRIGDYLEINEREHINNALSIGWNAYIAANDGTYAPAYAPGTGMVLAMPSGGYADLDFWGRNWGGDGTPQQLTSFTHALHIGTNGRIGIGTTAPDAPLHIVGGPSMTSGWNRTLLLDATYPVLEFKGTGSRYAGIGYDAGYGFRLWVDGANNDVRGSGLLAMSVMLNGNVGIGTTNPTHKLSVNGTVQAKEVIVQTGWSDYVFKADYRLAPLSEVEGAIKREGHLPGVPSEAQVAKEGVSVGQVEAKLLAKIEELTLYMIEQRKDSDELRRENAELRARVARLENQAIK